jgi:hypothetical protein
MLQILRDANALQGSLKYNYDAVDVAIREQVIEAALDIRQRINRAQGDLIATGQKLSETKAVLPHGQFQDWVETEFGFSQRTAQNLMNVAERFAGKSETVSLFSDSALYLLAAPSTPAAAIDAAAEEAAATGASPTKERVKEIIAEHKPVRTLNAVETEAVVWRAVQRHGGSSPAKPKAPEPEERSITEDLDSAIRRAVSVYYHDVSAYERMGREGATDQLIMARLSQSIKEKGGSSGPGLYVTEHYRRNGGPCIRLLRNHGDSDSNAVLVAYGQSLIDHVRRAWGIPQPQTAQNDPISAQTATASTNTPAATPRHDFAASVPVAGPAANGPIPLTVLEIQKLLRERSAGVGDKGAYYQFVAAWEYWRDALSAVPDVRTLDSQSYTEAYLTITKEIRSRIGLDELGRSITAARPAVEIVDDDESDEVSDADQRLFDAKMMLATITNLLDRLDRYGELTGKFLDIPATRRNLIPMQVELRNLINALET